MTTTDSTRVLARAALEPDLAALRRELSAVLSHTGTIRDRQDRAQNTRQCVWDNQSADYRKWDADAADGQAKPFNGAPDQRVPVVDIVTRERIALYTEALTSGEIQAQPIGGLDQAETATRMTRTLRWLRANVLADELRSEAELLHSYLETDDPGIAILKICWRREPCLEMRTLSLDDVGQRLLELQGIQLPDPSDPAAGEALRYYAGAIEDVGDLLFNPGREAEAVEAMLAAFPTVSKKLLRRALRELRRSRSTALPLPYVKENRPGVAALRYMHDVFFPPDIDDIQKSRVLYEREWLSEAELRSRTLSEGYDAEWVELVLERGPGGGETDSYRVDTPWTRGTIGRSGAGEAETEKLYEVWHAYSRSADDYGIPGVYQTVFSDKVSDAWAKHELLDYPDGEYPHVLFKAEIVARGAENVRGTPDRAGSLQSDIKLQRDCRGAHTMLATIPPVRVTQRRGGLEAVLGPMVEVPVREADDVTWMQPPQFPAASIEMEKAAWSDLNQYFGRLTPGATNELAQAVLQNDVNRVLGRWGLVWTKIMQLQQAYGDPVEMQLVAGGPVQTYTREEIRGRFSTLLTFSVRDLNMEFVTARNQAIAAALTQDINGLVDRTVIVRASLRAIDPNLAEQSVRDPQVVTQKEIEDERSALGMMATGIQPPLRQSGINAQLRLDTLQRSVFESPVLARRVQQPATPEDEYFKQLVEERLKNLQFLVEQYNVNPQIGLQGTRALQAGAGTAA